MQTSEAAAPDFDDDEDFRLSAPTAKLEDTRPPLDDDAASIDLYGDVADGNNDDFASLYGSGPAPNQQTQEELEEQIMPADRPGPSENGTEQYQSDAGARVQQSTAGEGPVVKRGSAASSSRGEPSYGTIDAVYVGNLQWWTTDAQIEELCSQFGSVQKFRFFEDKANGKSKGYVLVTFDSPKAAYTCKEGLDGTMVDGKKCVVTFAKQKEPGKGQGAQRDGTAMASTSQGPTGRGAAYRGRSQEQGGRGPRMRPPVGDPPFSGSMGGGGGPGMGWNGGPGMGPGPFMPPGIMGPGMGPMGPGMPFMPPGFPPGMQHNMHMGRGTPYARGPMNNFKRPRY
ncbi:RNA-binding domain-containing protein [Coccomyxa subellipsoidea C-169]|uniref:RNA-binding domain-containing protein n=1 Tax=Coccomyxa subellipsoidea (strain C-169) TaxID=574566 RepID=I0YKQ9_COCSC|nr:RNA-binding domain-containing protein [Coccomyxa subellipsoidea C-169]EIE18978.1 RNA-binding domain-containing protein [Coccomyxa subellipsoidea C-169]|eukprot:XP_005643522.1 RNA-binding domain-containing protein [Coccomyxa subellipsoidea C-169]